MKEKLKKVGIVVGVIMWLFILMIVAIAIFEPAPTEKKRQKETTGSAVTTQAIEEEKTKEPKETKKTKETKQPEATKTEEPTLEPIPTPVVEKKYKKPSMDDLYSFESGDMYVTMSFVEPSENLIQVSLAVNVLGEEIGDAEYYSSLKKGEVENTWISDDGRMTFMIANNGSVEVKDSDMSVEYNLTGTYTIAEFYEEETTTEKVEFIGSAEFRDFIGDTSNIGRTVKFRAEVATTLDGWYFLHVWNDDKLYQVRANIQSSDPALFGGDIVLFTGTYNGNTEAGNELSFSSVSIELQQ